MKFKLLVDSLTLSAVLTLSTLSIDAKAEAALRPPSNIEVNGATILATRELERPIVSSGVFPGTNIRHSSCIGTRTQGINFHEESNWFDRQYSDVMQTAVAQSPSAFVGSFPCLMKKIVWREFYVQPSLAPASRAQARDPNWSNYSWNQSDEIAEILNNPLIRDGVVKLALWIADTASGHRNAPPQWMVDQGLTFGNANERRGRYDILEAQNHLIDFWTAILAKYGHSNLIHSMSLDEYFLGPQSTWPADFDRDTYHQGRLRIWREIIASAPLDANGNRMAIYQTNIVSQGGTTAQDIIDIQLGVTQSDVHLFKDGCGQPNSITCDSGTLSDMLQRGFGKVPTMSNGDVRAAREGRQWTWSGISNPFGYDRGRKGVASPQELFWYHGSEGVVPLDSMFLNIDDNLPPQTTSNFLDAIAKFGAGGTLSENWGTVPILN